MILLDGQTDLDTVLDTARSQEPLRRRTPLAGAWDWSLKARCRGAPLEIFFPPDDLMGARRRRSELRAKRICRSCAVLERCRAYAVNKPERHGVWGGLTATERRLALAERPGTRSPHALAVCEPYS